MLTETLELTLAHVGLGALDETALLMLFGSAHAHLLVAGRSVAGRPATIRDLVNKAGVPLYPSYYYTHLRVPPSERLERFEVWDRLDVGVDARVFANFVIDSSYVLARPGEVPPTVEQWDPERFVTMRSGSMFIVEDQRSEPQVGVPRPDLFAELPRLARAPEAMERFRDVRVSPGLELGAPVAIRSREPVRYPVEVRRDAAPGHALMFAVFGRIAERAERVVLTEHAWPPMPRALASSLSTLERETYYFANCYPDDVVRADVRLALAPSAPDAHGTSSELVSVAVVSSAVELFSERTGAMLVASRGRKLLVLPSAQQSALRDATRLLAQYGDNAAPRR